VMAKVNGRTWTMMMRMMTMIRMADSVEKKSGPIGEA
jgi:hypothetical protein